MVKKSPLQDLASKISYRKRVRFRPHIANPKKGGVAVSPRSRPVAVPVGERRRPCQTNGDRAPGWHAGAAREAGEGDVYQNKYPKWASILQAFPVPL